MFFYLGKNCPLKSLINVTDEVFLDHGWDSKKIHDKTFFYKGYSLDCVLEDSISEIVDGYIPAGKWAVLSSDKKLHHPNPRGFPVYTNHVDITNIPLDNFSYVGYEKKLVQNTNNKITLNEASEKINDILIENINNFFKFNKNIEFNVLYSAGIDSLTCWALVEALGYNYKLHIHVPSNYDNTHQKIFNVKTEYQSDLIDLCREKFWGYKMTSCFSHKNYFITGFYSERFQLREVSTGHIIANFLGKKLHEIPDEKNYLYYFLQRPVNKINNEPNLDNIESVMSCCNDTIFYDHQMWHIDNNFHFSPFFDVRITEIINQLSLTDIINNAMNAQIQKNIILKNKPEFLNLLSDYKNERAIWSNFQKNFQSIKLNNVIEKNINI